MLLFSLTYLLVASSAFVSTSKIDGVDILLKTYNKAFADNPPTAKIDPVSKDEFIKAIKRCLEKNPPKSEKGRKALKRMLVDFNPPATCKFNVKQLWVKDRTRYEGCRILFIVGHSSSPEAVVTIRRVVESSRKLMKNETEIPLPTGKPKTSR